MALLRAALKKTRPWAWGWHFQQRLLLGKGKLGNLGAIGRSIVGQNFISNGCCRFPSLFQSRRHYFLPPPPPQLTVDLIYECNVAHVSNDCALPSAEFAVNTHNETKGEKKIRFVRVVRASGMGVAGMMFYITLEGVDEDGELNVYYAEVLDRPYENFRQLIKWQLVDESFSYPFEEIRRSDRLIRQIDRDREVASNNLVSTWLQGMLLQSRDYKTNIELIFGQPKGKPDPIKEIIDFEEKSLMSTDICLPCPCKNDMNPFPIVASDVIVPVYDIMTYQKVYNCALFAVSAHNKNEDDEIHLEEVLWASKSNVDNGVYYFLLLEVMDGKKELKFYNAIIKISQSKKELINWHLIDESFSKQLQKDQIRLGA